MKPRIIQLGIFCLLAAALFSIWLGPEPLSRSFKTALLGQG